MKKLAILFLFSFFSFGIQAQSFIGAWETLHTSDDGLALKSVVIFSDGYQVMTTYHAETGKFVSTNGGSWSLEGDTMTEVVEFDSKNPERVGTKISFEVYNTGDEMGIVGQDMKMTRIDNGSPGKLQGAWLMSGRVRDGAVQERDTNRPRKTMKILSGSRFQWIAYHTETKEFKGTGGGTYSTVGGEYTENIEFFSRDDNKAGLSLNFNYELIDGKWNHSGLSSKGDPIHEIWSLRK